MGTFIGGRLYFDFRDDSKLDTCAANLTRYIDRIMIDIVA